MLKAQRKELEFQPLVFIRCQVCNNAKVLRWVLKLIILYHLSNLILMMAMLISQAPRPSKAAMKCSLERNPKPKLLSDMHWTFQRGWMWERSCQSAASDILQNTSCQTPCKMSRILMTSLVEDTDEDANLERQRDSRAIDDKGRHVNVLWTKSRNSCSQSYSLCPASA